MPKLRQTSATRLPWASSTSACRNSPMTFSGVNCLRRILPDLHFPLQGAVYSLSHLGFCLGRQVMLLSVQPRIRLTRSFDQRSHTYLGYTLKVRGIVGSEA